MIDDYNNDYYLQQQMNHDDVDPDQALKSGCFVSVFYLCAIIVAFLLCALFGSCKEYVPIIEKHESHHWHTDSVIQKDSVYHEKNTTIMQLDSEAMVKYGIQLKAAERAWLVQTSEMERRLNELTRMVQDKDTVRDTIPAPYPVIKEVPTDLTWWQQLRMHLGGIVLFLALIFVVAKWGVPLIKKLF